MLFSSHFWLNPGKLRTFQVEYFEAEAKMIFAFHLLGKKLYALLIGSLAESPKIQKFKVETFPWTFPDCNMWLEVFEFEGFPIKRYILKHFILEEAEGLIRYLY